MRRRRFIFNVARGLMVPLAAPLIHGATVLPQTPARGAVSDGSFSPTSISGLQLWLDGSDSTKLWQDSGGTVAVSSDADPVRLWQDKSGNSNHGTAASDAARPLYKTNIQNGLSILRFDGSDDGFSLPNAFTGLTAGEIFCVIKKVADPSASSGKGSLFRFGTDATDDALPATDGIFYCGFGSNARKTTVNPATSTTAWTLLNFASASADWKFRLNTTQEYTTATNTVAWSTTPRIGRGSVSGFWEGDIAEVLLYNSVLSAGNRTLVTSYLDTKWNLPY